ncbi:MAG TPA: hypothetical protein VHB73_03180 [Alphaproteobacteria bacterium]|nr:hypothetical protein [Alphaproteobacteria bacterium]
MQNLSAASGPSAGLYVRNDIHTGPAGGVAWGAILAGAATVAAAMLILFPLGAALGFSALSPWHPMNGTGKALTMLGAVWLIVVQWLSAGLGGYLTGRLRTAWQGAHTHEVFFRDTVHGFLAWAVAALASLLLLAAAATTIAAHHSPRMEESANNAAAYYSDSLFRSDSYGSRNRVAASEQDRVEAGRILMRGMGPEGLADDDRSYLAGLVSQRAGLSSSEAEKRVDDTVAHEKAQADKARKAAATASVFAFLAMLIGAFIASTAGALGGAHRDAHYETGRLD